VGAIGPAEPSDARGQSIGERRGVSGRPGWTQAPPSRTPKGSEAWEPVVRSDRAALASLPPAGPRGAR
jgi:hypothetical protein